MLLHDDKYDEFRPIVKQTSIFLPLPNELETIYFLPSLIKGNSQSFDMEEALLVIFSLVKGKIFKIYKFLGKEHIPCFHYLFFLFFSLHKESVVS